MESIRCNICSGYSNKVVNLFFPTGSLRRKIAVMIWNLGQLLLQIILKVYRKLDIGFQSFIKYLTRLGKPEKGKRIITQSKKIVFIGHSYHNKTKSTGFLVDYLKQYFDVEIILDESWLGEKPFPDLSFIDDTYLGVIFFQNLPKLKILRSIKNENIIFFPMYDSVSLDYNFWKYYKNLKIVNFSKTLNDIHVKQELNSIYVQYFPKPNEFIPGNKDEVFFWNRITKINFNTIKKLFENDDLKIHIHKAIDPNHQFIQPGEEDEKKFQIVYSDWFETREDMWNLIKQKGIYISPREFEGIGMSFLEAMAMGKAIIAANNPTMNEYIKHNSTGYLCDLSDPQPINLDNIREIQLNAFNYIYEGYKKWERDKHKIIDFILS